MKLLIGADPEVFASIKGQPVSAHGLLPGSKLKPHPVINGAVQVDGVAMEFNITPARTEAEFVKNIFSVYGQMLSIARSKSPEVEPLLTPIVKFTKTIWDGVPRSAKILGCSLDMDAYLLTPRAAPNIPQGVRTAAGHIHIGWCKDQDIHAPDHLQMCAELTKALDVTFKCTEKIDPHNVKRQRYYGPWGAFRPKTYGMEYRSLSNFWLQSEALTRWIYQRTAWTVASLRAGREVRMDTLNTAPDIPIIN